MRLVIFITAIFFSACATRTVTFSVNEKASINLVTPANTDGQGERIGEAPQTIALNRLEGKVVKISGPGLLPQFWVRGFFLFTIWVIFIFCQFWGQTAV